MFSLKLGRRRNPGYLQLTGLNTQLGLSDSRGIVIMYI